MTRGALLPSRTIPPRRSPTTSSISSATKSRWAVCRTTCCRSSRASAPSPTPSSAAWPRAPSTTCRSITEVLQDTMLDLFDSGKLDHASSCSLSLSASPGLPEILREHGQVFRQDHPAAALHLQRTGADPPSGVHRHEHPGGDRHLRPCQLHPGRRHPHDQRPGRLRRLPAQRLSSR